jgi:1-deoxy-D-xylulose-5-phosphate synthase
MKICAPADEAELVHMTHTLAELNDCPSAMRYPRGASYGDLELPSEPEFLEPGKGRIVQEGRDGVIAILSLGSRLRESIEAAERLKRVGIHATVADARWVKPLDNDLVSKLANDHRVMITVEENSIGGFSAQVQQFLLESGAMDGCNRKPLVLRSMVLPDRFIPANEPKKQYDDAQLNAAHIVTKALAAISRTDLKLDIPVEMQN